MGITSVKAASTVDLTVKQISLLKGFIRDCPSGQLDQAQFTNVYQKLFYQGNPDKFSKYVFNTLDQDRNGFIDFNELLLAVAVSSQGNLEDRLDAAFDMYDTSDDGRISIEEMTNMLQAMSNLVGISDDDVDQRAHEIIKELGGKEDRGLLRHEFIQGCMNNAAMRKILAPNV
ncbi:unnamed protein product [Didymodactylos carnosus]|uniref:EF-hand domain-containing protein n=1 Tax=Didymodactylos carnosus TaxID=1234261 RepID=A0A814HYN1_9BILA|nr:unnamed protein product [Didymodactylos carnosus]CAF1238674.1 unnamed protein product [Didymodactylos carnosus]CAF3787320.1 unnamed protein product [Didymodactylos carnosus]CAF4046195.1 unnamed protein product [Didymodactylos carnosus]